MANPKPPFAPVILLVDDDAHNLALLQRAFQGEPCELLLAPDGAAALELLQERDVDLVITDLEMPRVTGLELLEHIRRAGWDVDVMVITGHASLDHAVQCMRLETLDFLAKPFDIAGLLRRVREIVQKRLLRREHRLLRSGSMRETPMLVGGSRAMQELRDLLRRVAASDEIVLVGGESGTGKELVARAIHSWSRRGPEPFLAVDCTTLSSTVVESELFGHVKGAFTGAEGPRIGLLQAAGRGTILLDEIGDLPLDLQPKLLRAIQEREVRPVGSNQSTRFEARVVAATNRDLEALVRQGKFREDLYWRLNVVSVRVPPLRERREDIPELVRAFIKRYDSSPEAPREIDPATTEALRSYDWPGNVRELENCVRRMLALHPDALVLRDVPRASAPAAPTPQLPGASIGDWEQTAIRSALAAARGQVSQAARSLGMSKSTLYRKLKEYGIEEK